MLNLVSVSECYRNLNDSPKSKYLCYTDTSSHSWSLDHLHASLHLSDATILNVTSRRSELIPQKAVRYEVRVE